MCLVLKRNIDDVVALGSAVKVVFYHKEAPSVCRE